MLLQMCLALKASLTVDDDEDCEGERQLLRLRLESPTGTRIVGGRHGARMTLSVSWRGRVTG